MRVVHLSRVCSSLIVSKSCGKRKPCPSKIGTFSPLTTTVQMSPVHVLTSSSPKSKVLNVRHQQRLAAVGLLFQKHLVHQTCPIARLHLSVRTGTLHPKPLHSPSLFPDCRARSDTPLRAVSLAHIEHLSPHPWFRPDPRHNALLPHSVVAQIYVTPRFGNSKTQITICNLVKYFNQYDWQNT